MEPRESLDPAWKTLYKVGGLSLLSLAALHIIDYPLFFLVGGAEGAERGLIMIAERRLLFQIHGVLVLGFLLLIPGVLALYLGLRHGTQNVMLVAAAAGLLASTQVGWIAPLVLSEVALSDGYMAAVGEAQRAAYLAVTDFVRVALSAGFFMRFFLFFLFILGSGLVMREGNFGRRVANLSLWGGMAGILGILGLGLVAISGEVGPDLSSVSVVLAALGFAPIILLTPIWSFIVGYRLYRYGKAKFSGPAAESGAGRDTGVLPRSAQIGRLHHWQDRERRKDLWKES